MSGFSTVPVDSAPVVAASGERAVGERDGATRPSEVKVDATAMRSSSGAAAGSGPGLSTVVRSDRTGSSGRSSTVAAREGDDIALVLVEKEKPRRDDARKRGCRVGVEQGTELDSVVVEGGKTTARQASARGRGDGTRRGNKQKFGRDAETVARLQTRLSFSTYIH